MPRRSEIFRTQVEAIRRSQSYIYVQNAYLSDAVIIHELAHLRVSGHGPDFQALVSRYPLAERATGYLMALSHHADARPAQT